jgi:prevent-host-death family protein
MQSPPGPARPLNKKRPAVGICAAYTPLPYNGLRGKLSLVSLVCPGGDVHIVNIHEAKTHLSKLVDQAARGEAFIIAKAGKPLVKVSALDTPLPTQVRRLGFMVGEVSVPDDFDRMGAEEINQLFSGGD